MGARLLDIGAAVSAAVLAVGCWMFAGGADPGKWELSFPDIQLHAPAAARWGIKFEGNRTPVFDRGIHLQRYLPLDQPLDGPPPEYDNDRFPFTAWLLALRKESRCRGFLHYHDPIFDRSGGHPRLVGTFDEWGAPYWSLILPAAILPLFWLKKRLPAVSSDQLFSRSVS